DPGIAPIRLLLHARAHELLAFLARQCSCARFLAASCHLLLPGRYVRRGRLAILARRLSGQAFRHEVLTLLPLQSHRAGVLLAFRLAAFGGPVLRRVGAETRGTGDCQAQGGNEVAHGGPPYIEGPPGTALVPSLRSPSFIGA